MATFTTSFPGSGALGSPWSQLGGRDMVEGSGLCYAEASGSANDSATIALDPTGQSISATSQRATIVLDGLRTPSVGSSNIILWLLNSSFTGYGIEISRGSDGVYDWSTHTVTGGEASDIDEGSFGVSGFPSFAQGQEAIVQIDSGVLDIWLAGEHIADGLDASGLGNLVNCIVNNFPRSTLIGSVTQHAISNFEITDELGGSEDVIETGVAAEADTLSSPGTFVSALSFQGAASEASALAAAGTLVASTVIDQTFTGVAAESTALAAAGTFVADAQFSGVASASSVEAEVGVLVAQTLTHVTAEGVASESVAQVESGAFVSSVVFQGSAAISDVESTPGLTVLGSQIHQAHAGVESNSQALAEPGDLVAAVAFTGAEALSGVESEPGIGAFGFAVAGSASEAVVLGQSGSFIASSILDTSIIGATATFTNRLGKRASVTNRLGKKATITNVLSKKATIT